MDLLLFAFAIFFQYSICNIYLFYSWVGRRKEPILGYVPKNDEKKNSDHKGLMKSIETWVNIIIIEAFLMLTSQWGSQSNEVHIIFMILLQHGYRWVKSVFKIIPFTIK